MNEKSKRDFWQAEVTKMIELCGAPVDKADVPKIVDYLSSTYCPLESREFPVDISVAPRIVYCRRK